MTPGIVQCCFCVCEGVLLAAVGDDEPCQVEQAIPGTWFVMPDLPGLNELSPASHLGWNMVRKKLDLHTLAL